MTSRRRKDIRAALHEFLKIRDNLVLLAEIELNRRQSGVDWPTFVVMMQRRGDEDMVRWNAVMVGLAGTASKPLEEAQKGMDRFLQRFNEWRSQIDSDEDAGEQKKLRSGGT